MVRVGERSVSVRTTSHDKGRFTVTLGGMPNGRKLKSFVKFKFIFFVLFFSFLFLLKFSLMMTAERHVGISINIIFE